MRDRAPAVIARRAARTARKQSPSDDDGRVVLLPSFHSEPTREVLMQSGPGKQPDRMTIAYHGSEVEFDLSARGTALLAGTLESEIVIDGASYNVRGDWESVCWYADEDGDYLELRCIVNDSVWIDRQMLLSRHSRLALIADAVVARGAERLEYRMRVPAADGVAMRFDSPTRECRLAARRCHARAFPLALPQDRVNGTAGSFLERDGRLELTQVGSGGGLYVPVVLDWDPRRGAQRAEWRSLTVTETGRVVSPDRAAGHRLRVGGQQLLIYKSLETPDDARAVLGYHTWYDAVVGTLDATGAVEPMVMVEV
jgi:hypothetical protein